MFHNVNFGSVSFWCLLKIGIRSVLQLTEVRMLIPSTNIASKQLVDDWRNCTIWANYRYEQSPSLNRWIRIPSTVDCLQPNCFWQVLWNSVTIHANAGALAYEWSHRKSMFTYCLGSVRSLFLSVESKSFFPVIKNAIQVHFTLEINLWWIYIHGTICSKLFDQVDGIILITTTSVH